MSDKAELEALAKSLSNVAQTLNDYLTNKGNEQPKLAPT